MPKSQDLLTFKTFAAKPPYSPPSLGRILVKKGFLMPHYDLYSAIGLNRSSSSQELIDDIDARIIAGKFDNPGGEEELRIARNVLGDEQVRGVYDSKLADPQAPEITVPALQELSAQATQRQTSQYSDVDGPTVVDGGESAGSTGATQGLNAQGIRDNLQQNFDQLQSKTQPYSEKARSEIARSSRGVIVATAAITALVCLLIWGLFSFFGSGNSVDGAKGTVRELISLEEDDANSWMRDNVDRDNQTRVERVLQDDGDFQPFEDVIDYNEPQAGQAIDGFDVMKGWTYSSQASLEELAEDEGIDNIAIVIIDDRNGEDTGWRVGLYERDGDWLIQDIWEAENVRNNSSNLF